MEKTFNFSSNTKRYILKGIKQWLGSLLILSIIAGLMSHTILTGVLTFLIILPFWGIIIFTPFLIIYFNHRKYNKKCTLKINDGNYQYSDNSGTLSFTNNDIEEVSFHTLLRKDLGKPPFFWQRMSFSIITLRNGEKIFLSCFLFDDIDIFFENDTNTTAHINEWRLTQNNTNFPKLKKRLLPLSNNNLKK